MYQSNTKTEKRKSMWRMFVLLFGLFILGFQSARAQNVEANSTLSADSILIGQHLVYELQMKVPQGFRVKWPQFSDTLTSTVEIIEQGKAEQLPPDQNGNLIWKQQLLVTSFDTGFIYIPAIAIDFAPEGDSNFYQAQTNPLMLRVFSVDVDTSAAFKPIKGIEEMPLTFAEVFPWIVSILGIALILFLLIWWYMRRRNRHTPIEPLPLPVIEPHLRAIEKLEELRLQKLWQNGKVKEYHTALSDIIREYIELQFPVNAIEMTTQEILDGIKPLKINEEAVQKLSVSLELADLVKFAKAQPTALENDMCLNHLLDFVKESYANSKLIESNETGKEEKL